jgi:putative transcriptional regulator
MMDNLNSDQAANLTGKFLVSTPNMPDPRFAEHVIFICAHSSEGAMGFAVNQPYPSLSLAEILTSTNIEVPSFPLPSVYIGGPVELESAFILYTSEYTVEHKLAVSDTISLTREVKVLEDIVSGKGPNSFLFLLGYSGWGPGQLERELVDSGWLILPANDEIIFSYPDDLKWKAAAMQYGIDIASFDDAIGYS